MKTTERIPAILDNNYLTTWDDKSLIVIKYQEPMIDFLWNDYTKPWYFDVTSKKLYKEVKQKPLKNPIAKRLVQIISSANIIIWYNNEYVLLQSKEKDTRLFFWYLLYMPYLSFMKKRPSRQLVSNIYWGIERVYWNLYKLSRELLYEIYNEYNF